MRTLAFALLLARPAFAADDAVLEREEYKVLGWNDACGVAYQVLAYPKLGKGMREDPVETRVSTLSIPPQQEEAAAETSVLLDGEFSWDRAAVEKAAKELKDAGFSRAGFGETVRTEIGRQKELAEVLFSTKTFDARLQTGWPGRAWRLAGTDFNPLSNCALLVYARRADELRHRFLLIRVYSPRARLERARAHVENALLLYAAGNGDASAAEAETAARLGPELPAAHYHHASLLMLTGRIEEAMAALAEAVRLDPKLRAKAREDPDFEPLRVRDDFNELMREPADAPKPAR